MKAKYKFEIMDLDDGLVAIPVGGNDEQFHGVLKVNESAVAILKLLEQEITEKEIVNSLLKEYEDDNNAIEQFVHEFIETLKDEGIIE